MVTIEFELNKFTIGKGVWTMNNNLLKNIDYINTINNIIQEEVMNYASIWHELSSKQSVQKFPSKSSKQSVQKFPSKSVMIFF